MQKRILWMLAFAVPLVLSSSRDVRAGLNDDSIEVELSGTIASVACPSITVETSTGTIAVSTKDEDGESAEIDDDTTDQPLTCEELQNGSRVEAKGEYDPKTKVVDADEILANAQDDDPCNEDDIEVLDLSGEIRKVDCPRLKVRTSTGRVNVTTVDDDGGKADIEDQTTDKKIACGALNVGDEIDIKEGELIASTGKIVADLVHVHDDTCTAR
jgi:hypothetical protein